jgi:hypothetical protein
MQIVRPVGIKSEIILDFVPCIFESLTAEREQVRKIHYEFSPSWYSSVTEDYQDGENSCFVFFGLFPLLQLAIHFNTQKYEDRRYHHTVHLR